MNNRKLYIQGGTGIDEDKIPIVGEFCNFCADNLPIDGSFEIYVVSDRDEYGITTTAAYIPSERIVLIYAKNRAVADVLRSIAHEMVHMMQDEKQQLNQPIQDIGGFHEDQANSLAGQLVKMFAKSSPERKRIYERRRK